MPDFREPGPEYTAIFRKDDWRVFEFDSAAECWRAEDVPLDDEEWRRARRLLDPAVRARFIAVRRAVRNLLASVLGLEHAQICYEFDRGKPSLAGAAGQKLRFNLSHCEEVALVALHATRRIGVDVELRRALVDVAAISRFVLTPRENEWIVGHAPGAQNIAFLRLWTLKEAALKAVGSGLRASPLDLEMPLERMSQPFRLLAPGLQGQFHRVEMTPLDNPRYLAAAAILQWDERTAPIPDDVA